MTSKSGPPLSRCSASSAGISLRQGAHQVAQKLTSRTRPFEAASVVGSPSAPVYSVSGAGTGSAWTTSLRMSPVRNASSSAGARPPAFAPAARPAYSRAAARLGRTGRGGMAGKTSSNAMWGGRFASGPDAVMEAINASIDFDRRL